MKRIYFLLSMLFIAYFSSAQTCTTPANGVTYTSNCTYTSATDVNIGSGGDLTVSGDANVEFTVNSYSIGGNLFNYGYLIVDEGSTLTINGDLVLEEFGVLEVYGTLNVNGNVTSTTGFSFGDRLIVGSNGVVNIDGDLDLTGPLGDGINGTVEGELNVTGTSTGTGNLPVELTYFQASSEEKEVTLEWGTATEVNASHFDVQRSADRNNWETLGTVEASGNSQVAISYTFEDSDPLPKAYYRLKQVDFDGVFEFFGPLQVALAGVEMPMELLVMPNNISNGEQVQFNLSGLDVGNSIEITVYNNIGNIVYTESEKYITSEVLLKPMNFTSSLGVGMYYIVVKSGKETIKEKLLIK
ncbi:T9SS type A sorting domain-containing protein [Flammeovirga sp. SJP92]|uniref:T9SS type A sorting domain-containing protein n=1 Tax=Flammeovirga sp. SJP92 TaxID=1775430 RepID=UPI000791D1E3|nr:T9SS type A sorting domain-containing protein [Flammeovirga sp. SJP92]KXX68491.1 hypothetical protein AVL50_22250 [Flammeovirga sp. SJP92]